jgi:hypothetical protein
VRLTSHHTVFTGETMSLLLALLLATTLTFSGKR